MFRLIALSLATFLAVSGCITETEPGVTRITAAQANSIRLNQLDLVNAVRSQAGVPPLTLSAELTAAADTHARDMAVQLRAWNFGSDRSSPQTRAQRAGFVGLITGEDVAETFLDNVGIFQIWVAESRSRQAMIDPRATHMGLGWYQEPNGKLWWVMDIAAAGPPLTIAMAE